MSEAKRRELPLQYAHRGISTGNNMTLNILRRFVPFQAVALLLAATVVSPAWAAVGVRVEGRPIDSPIQAFVRVTNLGVAVPGLNATNFALTLNGVLLAQLQAADVTLPPDQSNQKVSVVFVMDYTSSVTQNYLAEMESAVITFIDAMNIGDYAAILKFNNSTGASVVQAFIVIDQGVNNAALAAAVTAPYPGDGSNILDATILAVEHMNTQLVSLPLPAGPKAVILFTDGIDSHSSSTVNEVIGAANGDSIPIFTIGVGNPDPDALNLLTDLATETGGEFVPAPTAPDIADAYASVSELLKGEYLLTIPLSISDPITLGGCDVHTLDVTVAPHGSASADFTRRACDTAPDAFSFTSQSGVALNVPIESDTVTITGIEPGVQAAISVTIGTYSIGCTDTFTTDPGTISNNEMVCVRQNSSNSNSTSRVTTLTIGGVAGTFTTTTRAASGGGGGGGGGGATGGLELLAGLAALFARRRRLA